MDIRTPLIAIMVSGILIFVYLRKSLPQILTARIFFAFLMSVFFNNLFEIIECAVFLYLDNSYGVLRRVSQNFYVLTLVLTTFIMSLYVYSKTTKKRFLSSKVVIIDAIPLLVAFLSLMVMKIQYSVTNEGRYYNFGLVTKICYFVGFLYIFLCLLRIIVLRDRVIKNDYLSFLFGLIIWAALAFFQFFNRDLQVSAVGTMLMALILFLSMENPREYYEKSIEGVRNRDAFNMALVQYFGGNKDFFIVSVIFTGKTSLLSREDRSELAEMMKNIGKISEDDIGVPAYLFSWNCLCFLIKKPEKVEEFMTLINNFKDKGGTNYRLIFSVLEAKKYAREADEAVQILSYVAGEYVYTQSSPNLVIDQNVVDKMLYRNSIEDIVRQAVRDKAFDVYYQPILRVEDGSFSSAEALVRLRRPDTENYISPEDFIPIAEKCGLILEIDDLVFEKVCSFIARENLTSYGVRMVEVNLSGNEVVDEQTHMRLINKMNKYHISPKFINFEITETSYIVNDDVFQENVKRLKEQGSSFSMDDFGSGYSNLLEILKMDYALVKMDKEFIWKCLDKDRPENLRMLEYTINFLKDYGLHILAEGVETLDQAKLLIDKGVEYLQGFYYSRPVPEDEYIEFLKAQKGLFAKGEQL